MNESLIDKLSQIRDVKKRRVLLEKKGFGTLEIEKLLEEVHLRIKGKLKLPRAHQMKFNRDSLVQASSKYVAEYRTWKMRQKLGKVQKSLDVGGDIGGDTIAMALRWEVLSVERNPITMVMLKHNVQVYNSNKNVDFILGVTKNGKFNFHPYLIYLIRGKLKKVFCGLVNLKHFPIRK